MMVERPQGGFMTHGCSHSHPVGPQGHWEVKADERGRRDALGTVAKLGLLRCQTQEITVRLHTLSAHTHTHGNKWFDFNYFLIVHCLQLKQGT